MASAHAPAGQPHQPLTDQHAEHAHHRMADEPAAPDDQAGGEIP